jgi:hypothetical protein
MQCHLLRKELSFEQHIAADFLVNYRIRGAFLWLVQQTVSPQRQNQELQ